MATTSNSFKLLEAIPDYKKANIYEVDDLDVISQELIIYSVWFSINCRRLSQSRQLYRMSYSSFDHGLLS